MNKLLIALIGAATVGATSSALASPDCQAIEQARKTVVPGYLHQFPPGSPAIERARKGQTCASARAPGSTEAPAADKKDRPPQELVLTAPEPQPKNP